MNNVDSTLINVINEQLTGTAEPPPPIEKPIDNVPRETSDVEPESATAPEPEVILDSETPNADAAKDAAPIDEYGNPLDKPRMYTEEQVQSMIRDRLSRGRHAEQPTQQQVNQASEGFKHDANSEEPWEVQLERFIDKRLETREKEITQKQWQQQQAAQQADFESRFSTGMGKYKDFHQVVANKPITDSMLLATRSLNDPAAFVYAAAKMHPAELDRIAKIPDPYAQASEVGRLHERMVKESKVVSGAAKPLQAPRADMPAKTLDSPSLEQRIAQYAKQKRK
jgi:hypothetical protein